MTTLQGKPDVLCGQCGCQLDSVLVVLMGPGDVELIDQRIRVTQKQWHAFVETLKPGVTTERKAGT